MISLAAAPLPLAAAPPSSALALPGQVLLGYAVDDLDAGAPADGNRPGLVGCFPGVEVRATSGRACSAATLGAVAAVDTTTWPPVQ
jgi:hypothetical protein